MSCDKKCNVWTLKITSISHSIMLCMQIQMPELLFRGDFVSVSFSAFPGIHLMHAES